MTMMLSTDLNVTFYALLAVSVLSAMLTGSTLEWVVQKGRSLNSYNILVTIAAISSLIQTIACYVNVLMTPNNSLPFVIFILVNWVVMTHSSVMLVSKKLAMTFGKAKERTMWHRLLWINAFMLPISLFICIYWGTATYTHDNEMFQTINTIMEPIQITLWGIIEFCLSGAFIVQMWNYQWTSVERQSIYVLVLVGVCDTVSVLLNLFIGDLESTCVKGFVYALRIRLEVSVLDEMVEYVRKRRNPPTRSKGITTQEHEELAAEMAAEEGGMAPGTRQPAGMSWAMMSPTMFIASEQDEPEQDEVYVDEEVGINQKLSQVVERVSRGEIDVDSSLHDMAKTVCTTDDDDDSDPRLCVGEQHQQLPKI